MSRPPKPPSKYAVEGLSEDGRRVRILTREVDSADVILDEISQGARVLNPFSDVVMAMAPAVLLAVGIDPTPPAPPVAESAYTVYSPGTGGRAAEVRKFTPKWAKRALELERVGTLVADYDLVERAFGAPIPAAEIWDDEKSQVAWLVKFGKHWATIYDYQVELPPELNDVWSVAAHDRRALELVFQAVGSDVPSPNAEMARRKRRLLR